MDLLKGVLNALPPKKKMTASIMSAYSTTPTMTTTTTCAIHQFWRKLVCSSNWKNNNWKTPLMWLLKYKPILFPPKISKRASQSHVARPPFLSVVLTTAFQQPNSPRHHAIAAWTSCHCCMDHPVRPLFLPVVLTTAFQQPNSPRQHAAAAWIIHWMGCVWKLFSFKGSVLNQTLNTRWEMKVNFDVGKGQSDCRLGGWQVRILMKNNGEAYNKKGRLKILLKFANAESSVTPACCWATKETEWAFGMIH